MTMAKKAATPVRASDPAEAPSERAELMAAATPVSAQEPATAGITIAKERSHPSQHIGPGRYRHDDVERHGDAGQRVGAHGNGERVILKTRKLRK